MLGKSLGQCLWSGGDGEVVIQTGQLRGSDVVKVQVEMVFAQLCVVLWVVERGYAGRQQLRAGAVCVLQDANGIGGIY